VWHVRGDVSVAHRTYARALYQAAKESGRLPQVREGLEDFVEAIRSVPELRSVLRNPQIDRRAKASALESLVVGGEEVLSGFLRVLAEKGRAGEIEDIAKEFERLVAAAEGQLDVELTTAFELSDEEAQEIVGQIERASGRRVRATRSVDPDLIGGVVLQAGSMRLDASVRGRLVRLRHELATTRS
jgi:F-type H+-transporting ATPase subunit delta